MPGRWKRDLPRARGLQIRDQPTRRRTTGGSALSDSGFVTRRTLPASPAAPNRIFTSSPIDGYTTHDWPRRVANVMNRND
jgi:hypothetical protein